MPLPFSLSLLLLALVLLWFTRFQKTGKLLATLSLLLVTLMGMRPVSYELARGLEQTFPPSRQASIPTSRPSWCSVTAMSATRRCPSDPGRTILHWPAPSKGFALPKPIPKPSWCSPAMCRGSPVECRGQCPHGGEPWHSPRADDVV